MKKILSEHAQTSLSAMQGVPPPLVTKTQAFGIIKKVVGNDHAAAEAVWNELSLVPADKDLYRVPLRKAQ
jgi:hypothetical protein